MVIFLTSLPLPLSTPEPAASVDLKLEVSERCRRSYENIGDCEQSRY